MKKEEILKILIKIYSNQFSALEGLALIKEYIFERKGVLVENLTLNFSDGALYDKALQYIVLFYEQKFNTLKIYNKENQLISII